MPPKMKLHKDKGKLKSIPKSTSSNLENSAPQPFEGDSESRQQFEVELLWCIQQLKSALELGKLGQKQIQDSSKTLNSLMSNSTALIKKRQLMRGTFGDYRAKMAEERRKYTKINSKIVLTSAKPSKKSVFVKKAPFLTSGKDFKFNFKQSENIENAADKIANLNLEDKSDAENLEKCLKLKETHEAIEEPINTSGNSESPESAHKRKNDENEENIDVNQYKIKTEKENSEEPPCKMFHYQASKNEFRFNFTENCVQ